LPYERLIEIKKIGYGQFGEVLSGYLMDCDMPSSTTQQQPNFENNGGAKERMDEIVSQKKCKILARSLTKNSEECYTTEFRRQIDLFRTVESEHVVRLLATSFEKNQYYMVLEHGQDLKSYLTSHSNVDDGETITFCTHVARGLEHIAKLKLTHR
jgi:serine/threonine protein kinase